jgi:hypothetical protein
VNLQLAQTRFPCGSAVPVRRDSQVGSYSKAVYPHREDIDHCFEVSAYALVVFLSSLRSCIFSMS